MAGCTPNDAARTYVAPLRAALQCITQRRFTLRAPKRLTAATPYSLALDAFNPVSLNAAVPISLRAAQLVRIDQTDGDQVHAPFEVQPIQCVYAFSTVSDIEILSFHWTSEAVEPKAVTLPHLHIGRALTAGQAAIRPSDFHKAHIPTGHVSMAAVVRLAITEFGVTPLRPDWDRVLRQADDVLNG